MPIDYRRYPANWKTEIRPAILERAGHRCEECGVANHRIIWRKRGTTDWLEYDEDTDRFYINGTEVVRASEIPDVFADSATRVVLTISHTDHDVTNNDPANLRALCQRCHLLHDMHIHVANRKRNRLAKATPVESLPLFREE